jgi:hypothetical protein
MQWSGALDGWMCSPRNCLNIQINSNCSIGNRPRLVENLVPDGSVDVVFVFLDALH